MRLADQPGLNVTFADIRGEETSDATLAAYFSFNCQRNKGNRHVVLPIEGRIGRDPQRGWKWDGNMKSPSLTPSIHVHGCCHGYITAGTWDDRGPG